MKKIYFIILLITQIGFSQAPAIEWQKCLGGTNDDTAFCIQPSPDGGYIVAGYTVSTDGNISGNHGDEDVWIVKLNSSGNIQWQKCLGGTGSDEAYSIKCTSDGGYILAGNTNSTDGDVSGNHGGQDIWIVKLSITGNIQWQKCFGGTNSEIAYSIQITPDGGYIIAGNTGSNDGDVLGNNGGIDDAWIVKIDSLGNLEWQKCLGGTSEDDAESIKTTIDGGYIIAGYTDSNDGTIYGNHGYGDAWLVKLNNMGNVEWQKCLGGTSLDYADKIELTIDGGYIVAGATYSNDEDVSGNHGLYDTWVIKLNSSGNIEWEKCYGGTSYDQAFSIQPTTEGGYCIAGYTSSTDGDIAGNHGSQDAWIVKLNSIGNMEWQKCLGGTGAEEFSSIEVTDDGGYIFTGISDSINGDVSGNNGSQDIWVVKLAPDPLLSFGFETQKIELYPNPANNVLNIKTNQTVDKINITDMTGKKVIEEMPNSPQINISSLVQGTYILEVKAGKKTYKEKFIKK